MLQNIGATDRIIRVIAGLIIVSLAFVGPQSLWGYLGLLPLVTGLTGYCPVYHVANISTKRMDPIPRT